MTCSTDITQACPELDRAVAADMLSSALDSLRRSDHDFQRADLARYGFTASQIMDHGEAACRAAKRAFATGAWPVMPALAGNATASSELADNATAISEALARIGAIIEEAALRRSAMFGAGVSGLADLTGDEFDEIGRLTAPHRPEPTA